MTYQSWSSFHAQNADDMTARVDVLMSLTQRFAGQAASNWPDTQGGRTVPSCSRPWACPLKHGSQVVPARPRASALAEARLACRRKGKLPPGRHRCRPGVSSLVGHDPVKARGEAVSSSTSN